MTGNFAVRLRRLTPSAGRFRRGTGRADYAGAQAGQTSLSARDRHALQAIFADLAASDPDLAGRLGTFTQLTAGEAMPDREQIRARRARRSGSGQRALTHGQRWARVMIVMWLLVSAAMVTIAVVLSSGTPAPCKASWTTGCAQPTPSHSIPQTGP